MKTKKLTSQSGQAAVEYILLIIIVMAVMFGAVYQISTAFQSFAKGYFGDYLTCLLEAGELPSLGDGTGLCSGSYAPFSLANGRPYIGVKGPSGNGGAGGDGSSENDRNIAGSGDGASSSNEGAGSSRFVPVGSRGSSGFGSSSGRTGEGQSSEDEKKKGLAAATAGDGGFDNRGRGARAFESSETSSGTEPEDEIIGRTRFVSKKPDEKKQALRKDKVDVNEADRKIKGKRVPTSASGRAQGKEISDDDLALTLPNFIRFLLIAAIVIALVLFLGGQALAIKKGTEKS